MTEESALGIGDIAPYIPPPRISLEALLETRTKEDPDHERRFRRAIETTGQKAIRFPEAWQDNVCLAAEAGATLCSRQSGSRISGLRYLVSGTETTVDFSKPVSSWVQGLLEGEGLPIPRSIFSWQVQHACAAATIGFLSVASMLSASSEHNEAGMVIASDIARYEPRQSAEITQGAGSVAIWIEKNPRLLRVDISRVGAYSSDVDDFFRPLDSRTARVRGQFSIQCYHEAADLAMIDYARRCGKSPAQILEESDWLVFHVPFAKMAYTAARHLYSTHLGLHDGAIDRLLESKGFFSALSASAEVGNMYTGAIFFSLYNLLRERFAVEGDGIIGKKILFSSYGSGNTMVVFQAEVSQGAAAVISSWPEHGPLEPVRACSIAEYEAWMFKDEKKHNDLIEGLVPRGFYLRRLREDGFREYARG